MRNKYPENRIYQAIRSGRPALGMFNYIPHMSVIEAVGEADVDFVIIDTEHAVMDRESVERQIIAAQLNQVTPLVRVPAIDAPVMRSYLELGAQGILVPHIRCGEECRRAQDALRYPPDGHASTCRTNRSTGFTGVNWVSYLDWVRDASLIAMIEDPEGVERLDEILAELKPGRDMILFGKADYSQALGLIGKSGTVDGSRVDEAIDTIVKGCKAKGITFMVVPASMKQEDIQKAVENGAECLAIGVDQTVIYSAYKSCAEAAAACTIGD